MATRRGKRIFRLPGWQMLLAVGLAIMLGTAYLLWRDAALPGAIEGQTLTWRFQTRGSIPAPEDVAILAIDDATMAAGNRWPVSRRLLAEAVRRLHAAGVRAVGLDLLLLDDSTPEDDAALAEALALQPAVLPIAFTFRPDGEIGEDAVRLIRQAALPVVHRDGAGATVTPGLAATGALIPAEPFRGSAAGFGHVNVLADEDGVLRQIHLAVPVGGRHVPAFPVALARHHLGLPEGEIILLTGRGLELGQRMVRTDAELRLPLNYYGPPKTIPTWSLADLLQDRLPAEQLAGRVVLIGATATGTGDTFVTPFSRSLPGVEALATMLANLLDGRLLQRHAALSWLDLALIVGFGAAAFLLGHLPSPPAASLAVGALFAALVFAAQWAFQAERLWLNLTFPAAAILLNAGAVAVTRVMQERQQKTNLSRYHSPLIAELLARERPEAAERLQPAAIMFVDMAGFTARSESLAPEAAARFLREFHGHIERAVLAHGGVLDQFLGDGAMVIFGVGQPGAANAAAALACAKRLVETTAGWSRQLAARGGAPLAIRVGIHYGPVVISRLGGATQMHFSAAGDTVNVAARLESLTRSADSTITISDAVVAMIRQRGREALLEGFVALPPQPIRGRAGRMPVWTWHHAASSVPAA